MNKLTIVMVAILLTIVVVACAAPATQPPQQPAPTSPPQVVKETVVIQGTPQVVEKVITATPAPEQPTAVPARPNVVRTNFGVGDVPSLDPNVAEDTSSITVIDNNNMLSSKIL